MSYRVLPVFVAILALVCLVSGPAMAADKPHEGKIVRAVDGKLTMTDKDGKNEHTHTVAANATIKVDDQVCKLEDLKPGYVVKVTTEKRDNKEVATKIEAKKKAN